MIKKNVFKELLKKVAVPFFSELPFANKLVQEKDLLTSSNDILINQLVKSIKNLVIFKGISLVLGSISIIMTILNFGQKMANNYMLAENQKMKPIYEFHYNFGAKELKEHPIHHTIGKLKHTETRNYILYENAYIRSEQQKRGYSVAENYEKRINELILYSNTPKFKDKSPKEVIEKIFNIQDSLGGVLTKKWKELDSLGLPLYDPNIIKADRIFFRENIISRERFLVSIIKACENNHKIIYDYLTIISRELEYANNFINHAEPCIIAYLKKEDKELYKIIKNANKGNLTYVKKKVKKLFLKRKKGNLAF